MVNFTGTAGNDSLVGTAASDTFEFSPGQDTLIGGAGIDFAVGDLPDGTVIDIAQGVIRSGDQISVIEEIEDFEVYSANATIRGNDADNTLFLLGDTGVLEGGGGNDYLNLEDTSGTMSGGAGDDSFTMYGSGQTVAVQGGAGADTLSLETYFTDVTASVNAQDQLVLRWGGTQVTALDEIETFVFFDRSLSYAELLPITGTDMGEVLSGTPTSDVVNARAGNDWILASTGNDTIDGGAGTDMLSFVDLGRLGVNITLAEGRAFVLNGDRQSLSHIENLTGTSGADSLTGDAGANLIRGLGGSDLFFATAGGDLLQGGGGADLLRAGAFHESEDNTVSLLRGRIWEGEGTGTRFTSIEHLRTGGGDDQLTGDHGANRLEGNYGNDTLMGNGGDDLIYGGFGDDVALYSYDMDQYDVTTTEGVTTVSYIGAGAGDGTDTLLHIETLRFADGDLVL